PVELDTVVVVVAQIKGFADPMITGALELDARGLDAAQGIREQRARRIADGQMVKPGRMPRRRSRPGALPRVESDVVVIAAGRHERRPWTPLRHLESEYIAIERQRALQVGDFQVDGADRLRRSHR